MYADDGKQKSCTVRECGKVLRKMFMTLTTNYAHQFIVVIACNVWLLRVLLLETIESHSLELLLNEIFHPNWAPRTLYIIFCNAISLHIML